MIRDFFLNWEVVGDPDTRVPPREEQVLPKVRLGAFSYQTGEGRLIVDGPVQRLGSSNNVNPCTINNNLTSTSLKYVAKFISFVARINLV